MIVDQSLASFFPYFPLSFDLMLNVFKHLNTSWWHKFVVLRLTGCAGLTDSSSSGKTGSHPLQLSDKMFCLTFQDWGRPGDVAALGVCWHVPGPEEESFVFHLLSHLLHPELQRIKGHVSGEQPMSRCTVISLSFKYSDAIRQTHKDNK